MKSMRIMPYSIRGVTKTHIDHLRNGTDCLKVACEMALFDFLAFNSLKVKVNEVNGNHAI